MFKRPLNYETLNISIKLYDFFRLFADKLADIIAAEYKNSPSVKEAFLKSFIPIIAKIASKIKEIVNGI